MADSPGKHATDRGGRTNWKRFAIIAVPATVAVTGMFLAVGEGALATSIVISGQEAKISADTLDGEGFAQYGWADRTADPQKGVVVTTAAMKKAELTNLCQSVVVSLPIVGNFTLKIEAGGGGTPASADNIFIDLTHLQGDATFTNIEIGTDSTQLKKGPSGASGFQGMFGQQADKIHVDHLRQNSYATQAGTFRLNGLNMNLVKGSGSSTECY